MPSVISAIVISYVKELMSKVDIGTAVVVVIVCIVCPLAYTLLSVFQARALAKETISEEERRNALEEIKNENLWNKSFTEAKREAYLWPLAETLLELGRAILAGIAVNPPLQDTTETSDASNVRFVPWIISGLWLVTTVGQWKWQQKPDMFKLLGQCITVLGCFTEDFSAQLKILLFAYFVWILWSGVNKEQKEKVVGTAKRIFHDLGDHSSWNFCKLVVRYLFGYKLPDSPDSTSELPTNVFR